jgi:hypothetical protein
MGIIFWVAVLIVVHVVNRRRAKGNKQVKLMYPGGVGRMVGEWIVFPCNCRFHATTQNRFLCAAHDAMFAAMVRA